jgi:hypothetical protein
VYGNSNTVIYGNAVLNPTTPTYTHIYVVFPPQTSGNNNTNFKNNVMIQAAIDGVTIVVPWNIVENLTSPSQTDCTVLSPPMNDPDLCQPDPVATGWFHTYTWTSIDGSSMTPCIDTSANSSSQWFCDFPNGSGSFKQVNFQLFGIGGIPANGDTPSYVTSSSWSSATGGTTQDVVNTINASACGGSGYSGSYTVPSSTFTGGGQSPASTITVVWSGHPFQQGDTIWVAGFATSAFNVTGPYGATVTYINNGEFSYTGSGITSSMVAASGPNQTVVVARQSWPVPFEAPYSSAWQAFLKAAIYHFNNLNNVASSPGNWNLEQITSHIGYIRPGVARGGEAIPICTLSPPMATYSPSMWEGWYTQVNSTIQSANPLMQIMYSINSGDPQRPDATIATAEAGIAVSYHNATGFYNGFGSQGLAQSDTHQYPFSCPQTGSPNTGNNWGCMFTQFWSGGSSPTTVPLELQQIDCSNPCAASGACSPGNSSDGCFLPMFPGKTLDLRTLYPFATSNYASILELYSQDALLAFDPEFCDLSVSPCGSGGDTFGTDLSGTTQNGFFQYVGIGYGPCGSLYNVSQSQIGATGDCSYAKYISEAHGPH